MHGEHLRITVPSTGDSSADTSDAGDVSWQTSFSMYVYKL